MLTVEEPMRSSAAFSVVQVKRMSSLVFMARTELFPQIQDDHRL
jgi:hypothetical protein